MRIALLLLPLLLVVVLLVQKKHMLVAAVSGGGLAILLGRLDPVTINRLFLDGASTMLSITIPIIYAAAATMVAKAGCITAVVKLARYYLRGSLALLAAFLVIVQGLATYMAGLGASNTLVTAPLIAVAVGGVPEVIAAMAIVTGTAVSTSLASAEAALISQVANESVLDYASVLRPFTVAFFLLGACLAFYGVKRREKRSNLEKAVVLNSEVRVLWIRAFPAIALLILVVLGDKFNGLVGQTIVNPATTVLITAFLTAVLTPFGVNQTAKAFTDGAQFILVTLFTVGIFLGFINMIAELGTFREITSLAGQMPSGIVLPTAMLLGFLLALPIGAIAVGVLALILPTFSSLGLSLEGLGFVAMAVGLGTQVSPVQINVIALSDGFDLKVIDVVKINLRYVLAAFVFLIALSFVVV